MKRQRQGLGSTAGLGLALVLLTIGLALSAPPAVRWADHHWAGGRLKDAWGAAWWRESWADAMPLPPGLDEQWLASARAPLRVAHALGAAGSADANTLTALTAAARDGMRLFELDVWLDAAGALRCHHGPGDPLPSRLGDCTLESVLPRVVEHDGWLVLDIKTDFERTGERIIRLLDTNRTGRRVIFQLYRPAHTALFAAWSDRTALASPIVTAYASHRSVQHIADHLNGLHVKALTIPLESLPLLRRLPPGVALFLHPVHDCAAWQAAAPGSGRGIYTLSGLKCTP